MRLNVAFAVISARPARPLARPRLRLEPASSPPRHAAESGSSSPACAGAGLYGALAVERRSVAAVTTWWIDCRQFLEVEFDDVCSLSAGAELSRFGADYPAKHGIPLAGGPRWRLRRPSVSALEQGAGLVLRVRWDAVGAAWHGAEPVAVPSSSE
jgi:hypothetical protein